MQAIRELIKSHNPGRVSDCLVLAQKIKDEVAQRAVTSDRQLRFALLASFTSKGLAEALLVKCFDAGILADCYVGEYNQYAQELLNENSGLYRFNPDIVFILIDIQAILGERFFRFYQLDPDERARLLDEKASEIALFLGFLSSKTAAKVVFHNFEVPTISPLGILENKQRLGLVEFVQALNGRLRDEWRDNHQVFIFDFDGFCSRVGKYHIVDYKMYYLADMKLDVRLFPRLAEEYFSYLRPLLSLTKKCLVLDLDNTLWGGVIGEDGLEGIRLGPTPEGRPFWEFQKYLLSLWNQGVIFAINSRNNRADVQEVFAKHPHMVLKEDHFSAIEINWNDKASNLKRIARDLNIGLDSLVFFDDDPVNRELVRSSLPEVTTIEVPSDPALYLQTIAGSNLFSTFAITEEDRQRGRMYTEQRKRKELESLTGGDINEYLRNLQTVITLAVDDEFAIPRVSQLTQKTNQFNVTTRRYFEEEIREFVRDDSYSVISLKVTDRFGDSGLTGAAIVRKQDHSWHLDTFLLSCRVLGRKIEFAFLGRIAEYARCAGVRYLTSEFIPTRKNLPAKNFFPDFGFEKVEETPQKTTYRLELANPTPTVDYIEIRD
ncbi:MAG TPA: HAD family hydrolase [Acidobacteriota bacterium]|nr:HAD family hydrolase [Acidobacteriota bacterium]